MKRRAALWLAAIFLRLVPLTSPALAAPPTPESWFGHKIGADRQLLDWDKVVSYFYALARSSDKIRVTEYGRSAENRPLIVAIIADPETLANLDRYREIQRRLADPRITTPAEAEPMFHDGQEHRPDHLFDSCRRSGIDPKRGRVRLAPDYRKQPAFSDAFSATRSFCSSLRSIRMVSISSPAGIVRRSARPSKEPIRRSSIQKYVGHDNNRDWYIFSQPETRATISQLHNVWHPEIVYDVHQQGAYASRMFLPPWLDPTEPNIDPIVSQEMNALGASMASDLTAAGKTGIVIHAALRFLEPVAALSGVSRGPADSDGIRQRAACHAAHRNAG